MPRSWSRCPCARARVEGRRSISCSRGLARVVRRWCSRSSRAVAREFSGSRHVRRSRPGPVCGYLAVGRRGSEISRSLSILASDTPTSSQVSRSRSNDARCGWATTASTSTASSSPPSSASRSTISCMGSLTDRSSISSRTSRRWIDPQLSSKTDTRSCSRSNAPIRGGSPIFWLASRCDIPRCRSCSVSTRALAEEWTFRFLGAALAGSLDNPLS